MGNEQSRAKASEIAAKAASELRASRESEGENQPAASGSSESEAPGETVMEAVSGTDESQDDDRGQEVVKEEEEEPSVSEAEASDVEGTGFVGIPPEMILASEEEPQRAAEQEYYEVATEVTEATTEVTEATTEVTEATTEVTEATTEVTEATNVEGVPMEVVTETVMEGGDVKAETDTTEVMVKTEEDDEDSQSVRLTAAEVASAGIKVEQIVPVQAIAPEEGGVTMDLVITQGENGEQFILQQVATEDGVVTTPEEVGIEIVKQEEVEPEQQIEHQENDEVMETQEVAEVENPPVDVVEGEVLEEHVAEEELVESQGMEEAKCVEVMTEEDAAIASWEIDDGEHIIQIEVKLEEDEEGADETGTSDKEDGHVVKIMSEEEMQKRQEELAGGLPQVEEDEGPSLIKELCQTLLKGQKKKGKEKTNDTKAKATKSAAKKQSTDSPDSPAKKPKGGNRRRKPEPEEPYLRETTLHLEDGEYCCTSCEYVTEVSGDFCVHLQLHKFDALYLCHYCASLAQNIHSIRHHIKLLHPDDPLEHIRYKAPIATTIMDILKEKTNQVKTGRLGPMVIPRYGIYPFAPPGFARNVCEPIIIDDEDCVIQGPISSNITLDPDLKSKARLECSYADGQYVCKTCQFRTDNAPKFGVHIADHLHSSDTQCMHCRGGDINIVYKECALVQRMFNLLKEQKRKWFSQLYKGSPVNDIRFPDNRRNRGKRKKEAEITGGTVAKQVKSESVSRPAVVSKQVISVKQEEEEGPPLLTIEGSPDREVEDEMTIGTENAPKMAAIKSEEDGGPPELQSELSVECKQESVEDGKSSTSAASLNVKSPTKAARGDSVITSRESLPVGKTRSKSDKMPVRKVVLTSSPHISPIRFNPMSILEGDLPPGVKVIRKMVTASDLQQMPSNSSVKQEQESPDSHSTRQSDPIVKDQADRNLFENAPDVQLVGIEPVRKTHPREEIDPKWISTKNLIPVKRSSNSDGLEMSPPKIVKQSKAPIIKRKIIKPVMTPPSAGGGSKAASAKLTPSPVKVSSASSAGGGKKVPRICKFVLPPMKSGTKITLPQLTGGAQIILPETGKKSTHRLYTRAVVGKPGEKQTLEKVLVKVKDEDPNLPLANLAQDIQTKSEDQKSTTATVSTESSTQPGDDEGVVMVEDEEKSSPPSEIESAVDDKPESEQESASEPVPEESDVTESCEKIGEEEHQVIEEDVESVQEIDTEEVSQPEIPAETVEEPAEDEMTSEGQEATVEDVDMATEEMTVSEEVELLPEEIGEAVEVKTDDLAEMDEQVEMYLTQGDALQKEKPIKNVPEITKDTESSEDVMKVDTDESTADSKTEQASPSKGYGGLKMKRRIVMLPEKMQKPYKKLDTKPTVMVSTDQLGTQRTTRSLRNEAEARTTSRLLSKIKQTDKAEAEVEVENPTEIGSVTSQDTEPVHSSSNSEVEETAASPEDTSAAAEDSGSENGEDKKEDEPDWIKEAKMSETKSPSVTNKPMTAASPRKIVPVTIPMKQVTREEHEASSSEQSASPAQPGVKVSSKSIAKVCYKEGKYICQLCEYGHVNAVIFRKHLWADLHPKNQCSHCPPHIKFNKFVNCTYLNTLMAMLEKSRLAAVEANKKIAAEKKEACPDIVSTSRSKLNEIGQINKKNQQISSPRKYNLTGSRLVTEAIPDIVPTDRRSKLNEIGKINQKNQQIHSSSSNMPCSTVTVVNECPDIVHTSRTKLNEIGQINRKNQQIENVTKDRCNQPVPSGSEGCPDIVHTSRSKLNEIGQINRKNQQIGSAGDDAPRASGSDGCPDIVHTSRTNLNHIGQINKKNQQQMNGDGLQGESDLAGEQSVEEEDTYAGAANGTHEDVPVGGADVEAAGEASEMDNHQQNNQQMIDGMPESNGFVGESNARAMVDQDGNIVLVEHVMVPEDDDEVVDAVVSRQMSGQDVPPVVNLARPSCSSNGHDTSDGVNDNLQQMNFDGDNTSENGSAMGVGWSVDNILANRMNNAPDLLQGTEVLYEQFDPKNDDGSQGEHAGDSDRSLETVPEAVSSNRGLLNDTNMVKSEMSVGRISKSSLGANDVCTAGISTKASESGSSIDFDDLTVSPFKERAQMLDCDIDCKQSPADFSTSDPEFHQNVVVNTVSSSAPSLPELGRSKDIVGTSQKLFLPEKADEDLCTLSHMNDKPEGQQETVNPGNSDSCKQRCSLDVDKLFASSEEGPSQSKMKSGVGQTLAYVDHECSNLLTSDDLEKNNYSNEAADGNDNNEGLPLPTTFTATSISTQDYLADDVQIDAYAQENVTGNIDLHTYEVNPQDATVCAESLDIPMIGLPRTSSESNLCDPVLPISTNSDENSPDPARSSSPSNSTLPADGAESLQMLIDNPGFDDKNKVDEISNEGDMNFSIVSVTGGDSSLLMMDDAETGLMSAATVPDEGSSDEPPVEKLPIYEAGTDDSSGSTEQRGTLVDTITLPVEATSCSGDVPSADSPSTVSKPPSPIPEAKETLSHEPDISEHPPPTEVNDSGTKTLADESNVETVVPVTLVENASLYPASETPQDGGSESEPLNNGSKDIEGNAATGDVEDSLVEIARPSSEPSSDEQAKKKLIVKIRKKPDGAEWNVERTESEDTDGTSSQSSTPVPPDATRSSQSSSPSPPDGNVSSQASTPLPVDGSMSSQSSTPVPQEGVTRANSLTPPPAASAKQGVVNLDDDDDEEDDCIIVIDDESGSGDELQSDSLSETSARCMPFRRRRRRAPGELPPPLPSDDVVPSLNPQFVCAFAQCNSWSTDSETSFKLHCMSRHFKHRPMFCYMCSIPLPDEDVLIVHIKTTHPQVTSMLYNCCVSACTFTTNIMQEFRAHFPTKHPKDKIFSCTYCMKSFPESDKLVHHVSSNIMKLIKCPVCFVASPHGATIRMHMNMNHPKVKSKVIVDIFIACRQKSDSPKALTNDTRQSVIANTSHPGGTNQASLTPSKQKFLCTCQYTTEHQTSFLWHLRSCETYRSQVIADGQTDAFLPSPFDAGVPPPPKRKPKPPKTPLQRLGKGAERKCDKCNFTSSFDALLKTHAALHEKPPEKTPSTPHHCSVCPYVSKTIAGLRSHLTAHPGQKILKLYACHVCEMASTVEDFIVEHLLDEHPSDDCKFECKIQKLELTCPVCNQNFKTELPYLEHLHTHDRSHILQYIHDLYGLSDLPPDPEAEDDDCHGNSIASDGGPLSKMSRMDPAAFNAASGSGRNWGDGKGAGSDMDGQMQCPQCNYMCNEIDTWKWHMSRHIATGSQSMLVYFCQTCDWHSNIKRKVLDHCVTEHVMSMEYARLQGYEARYLEVHAQVLDESMDTKKTRTPTRSSTTQSVRQPSLPTVIPPAQPSIPSPQVPVPVQQMAVAAPSTGVPQPMWSSLSSIDISRYHCDYCEFSTNEKALYNQHMLIHGEVQPEYEEESVVEIERPAKKKQAGKTLPKCIGNRENMKYKCKLCPYATNKLKHFKVHRDTHAKQARIQEGFKCNYCEMVAEFAGNVTRHLRLYHDGKPAVMVRVTNGVAQVDSVADTVCIDTPAKPVTKPRDPSPEAQLNYSQFKLQKPRNLRTPPSAPPQSMLPEASSHGIQLEQVPVLPSPSAELLHPALLRCSQCNFRTRSSTELENHAEQHAVSQASSQQSPSPIFLSKVAPEVHTLSSDEEGENTTKSVTNAEVTEEDEEDVMEEEDVNSKQDDGELQKILKKITADPENRFCYKKDEEDNMYQCVKCSYKYRHPSKVIMHFHNRHERYSPFQCSTCEFTSLATSEVRHHLQIMHEGMSVQVIDTASGEPVDESLDKIRSEPPKYMRDIVMKYLECEAAGDGSRQRCVLCSFSRVNSSVMEKHLIEKHMPQFHPYKCRYCEVTGIERIEIMKHQKEVHPSQPFKIVQMMFRGVLPEIVANVGSVINSDLTALMDEGSQESMTTTAPTKPVYYGGMVAGTGEWINEDGTPGRGPSPVVAPNDGTADTTPTKQGNMETDNFENSMNTTLGICITSVTSINDNEHVSNIQNNNNNDDDFVDADDGFDDGEEGDGTITITVNNQGNIEPYHDPSSNNTSCSNTPLRADSTLGEVTFDTSLRTLTDHMNSSESQAILEHSKDAGRLQIKPEPTYDNSRYGQMPTGVQVRSESPVHSSPQAQVASALANVKRELHEAKQMSSAPLEQQSCGEEERDFTPSHPVALMSITPLKRPYEPGPMPTHKQKGMSAEGVIKRCYYCSYTTRWNISDVKTHILVSHLGKYPYGCKYCSFTGRDKKRLREHSKRFHGGKQNGFRYCYNDYNDTLYTIRKDGYIFICIRGADGPGPEVEPDLKPVKKYKKHVPTKEESNPMFNVSQTLQAQQVESVLSPPPPIQPVFNPPAAPKVMPTQPAPSVRREEIPLDLSMPRPFTPPYGPQPISIEPIAPTSATFPGTSNMEAMISPQALTPKAPSPVTDPDKHLVCKYCSYAHFDFYKMKTHILMKHCLQKPYQCGYCEYEEFTYHRVAQHVKERHAELPFRIRRLLNEKDAALRKKIIILDKNKPPPPTALPKRNSASRFRPFGCSHCEYKAMSRAKVKYHSERRHPHAPWGVIKFDKPGGNCGGLDPLPYNVSVVNGALVTPNHSCPHCNAILDSSETLNDHIAGKHNVSSLGIFQCPYCPSRIKYKSKMKYHLLNKHSGQPIAFSFVPFSQVPGGYQPVRKGKPILNSFVKKARLNIPDWKAKLGKRFGGDDPDGLYSCKSCSFTTRDQFVMRNHVQAHIGYNPYCCPYCDYGNVKSFPIKLHIAKHHPNEPVTFILNRDPDKEQELKTMYTRPNHMKKVAPPVLSNTHVSPVAAPAPSLVTPYFGTPPPLEDYSDLVRGLELPSLPGADDLLTPQALAAETSGLNDESSDPSLSTLNQMPMSPPSLNTSAENPPPIAMYSNFEQQSPMPKLMLGQLENEPEITPSQDYVRRSHSNKVPSLDSRYKCILCGIYTKNHTGIKRHLMWEMRYLPFMCPHCPFKCAHRFGVEKHCRVKHGVEMPEVVLGHNPEREAKIAELILQSKHRVDQQEIDEAVKAQAAAEAAKAKQPKITQLGFPAVKPPKLPKIKKEPIPKGPTFKVGALGRFKMLKSGRRRVRFSSHHRFLKCKLCDFKTQSYKTIQNHLIRHGPYRFECGYCQFQGYYPYEIINHSKKFHVGEPINQKSLNTTTFKPKDCIIRLSVKETAAELRKEREEQAREAEGLAMVMETGGEGGIQEDEEEVGEEEEEEEEEELGGRPIKVEMMEIAEGSLSGVNVEDGDAGEAEMETEVAPTPPPAPSSGNSSGRPRHYAGPLLIDGIEIHKDELIMNEVGYWACKWCMYSAPVREKWKNHVIKHIPPRWQCGYCQIRSQLSYELRRHVRKSHPSHICRMVKLAACAEDIKNFGGKIPIPMTGGPRWRNVGDEDWICGVNTKINAKQLVMVLHQGSLVPEDTLDDSVEVPSRDSINLSNLRLNCFYCLFQTQDPVLYADHLKSHTDASAQLASSGDDSQSRSERATSVTSTASHESDLLDQFGRCSVNLTDVMKLKPNILNTLLTSNEILLINSE